MRGMSGLRRVTGMGIAGSLALGLLAGGCVLAATTGPREAQATGLLGVRQLVDGLSPLDQTIAVASSWATINGNFGQAGNNPDGQVILSPDNLDDVTRQLRYDFSSGPLPLAPPAADWVSMTPGLFPLTSVQPSLGGIPAKLEVAFRYPVAGHLRLVAGRMPTTVRPGPANAPTPADLQVVVTQPTASAFGLQPGSAMTIMGPLPTSISGPSSGSAQVTLHVTGIVEPTDPGSAFWKADPLLAAPSLYTSQSKSWEGAVIADPSEIGVIQQIFGGSGLDIQWQLPVDPARLNDQAPALLRQVNQITHTTPSVTGPLAPISNALSASSGLLQPLAELVQAANGVNVLLWMIYVGLAAAGVVMMLLAARMIAGRRAAEMAVRRARGASLGQLLTLGSRGAAVACVPAAVLAWALAVLLVPGSGPSGWVAWWPGIVTVAVAIAGPGVAAAWPHRQPRRRPGGPARRRWRRRTRATYEVTACAAAIGGITVLRTQPGATDLYTSAAPLLVAVPAVIVVLRLYQLLLRGLARASAGRRGVIGFLGLTRAAQATATLALPAVTLVLTLTMAAFTIMLRDAVVHGETTVSWQETGADVVVGAPGQLSTGAVISPAAGRAIAAVPGVQHAATALVIPVSVARGEVTVIAVDPASYAALVASTEGFAAVSPAELTSALSPPDPGAIPVLASPRAAALLGGGPAGSTIPAQPGLPALRVRVTGELRSTPALPGGGAFIVAARAAIGAGVPLPVNLMLLTGPSIDMTRLYAAVQATMPGAEAPPIATRSRALRELTGAPLQHGTFLIFSLAIVFATVLALAVLLLELALAAADRKLEMARLATMGLAEGQRVRLAVLEVVPAIAAAAVAAAACAIALPRLVAPAINLAAFTGISAPVSLHADFASFLLPLAGLLVVTAIALAYEIRLARGRVAATMRA